MKFEDDDDESGKYKVEAIRDNRVYAKELEVDYLPKLYYLISWKSYFEKENTWEPISAI